MLAADLTDDAGRAAYLASFHIAQAFLFETSGKVFKTHHGVQTEFSRSTQNNPDVDAVLRPFLSRSYRFKSNADYFTGPEAGLSADEAAEAVAMAKRFVAHFTQLIAAPGSGER